MLKRRVPETMKPVPTAPGLAILLEKRKRITTLSSQPSWALTSSAMNFFVVCALCHFLDQKKTVGGPTFSYYNVI